MRQRHSQSEIEVDSVVFLLVLAHRTQSDALLEIGPRMTGKVSPDCKTVEFEFLDVADSKQHGHFQVDLQAARRQTGPERFDLKSAQ